MVGTKHLQIGSYLLLIDVLLTTISGVLLYIFKHYSNPKSVVRFSGFLPLCQGHFLQRGEPPFGYAQSVSEGDTPVA